MALLAAVGRISPEILGGDHFSPVRPLSCPGAGLLSRCSGIGQSQLWFEFHFHHYELCDFGLVKFHLLSLSKMGEGMALASQGGPNTLHVFMYVNELDT